MTVQAMNIVFIKLSDVLELELFVFSLQKASVVPPAAPICVLAVPLK